MRLSQNRILIAAALVAATASFSPTRADAQHVHVDIGIPLPSISFHVAPQLIALPGTYAYVVPDYEAELFFYDGFWWRPWEGRWYRSAYYDRGWEIYGGVPVFYSTVPRDWRVRYRNHDWDGHRWDYERVAYDDVKRNWSSWKRERRWDSAVRAAGERDHRTERSRGDTDRRIDGRSTSRESDQRIEPRTAPAPERRVEQKASPAPAERRVEKKSSPAQRSDRGPARAERSQPSGKGSTKVRNPSGDGRGSSKGGDNRSGGDKGAGGGKGHK
jgi:hypothetical protein